MIKKIITLFTSVIGMLLLTVTPAFAHVIVHPATVGVAAFQEFTMSVPTEKDNPTVAIRLLIPDGLKMVTPNVKPGWTINVVKTGSDDDAKVTEIDWTDGSIPSGERDDFVFQAQVPAKETTLNWKAYQTYEDGSVVAWDHDPKLSKGPDDDSAPPPYSTTKIINDLGNENANTTMLKNVTQQMQTTYQFSVLAFVLAVVALTMTLRKKQEQPKKNK